tara:strand:- start:141 stop:602 length:462 start_codon:yes stop_codon:yes gene_type:complete
MYDSLSVGYDELYGEEQLVKIAGVISQIGTKGKILDVGCGTAIYSGLFEDYTGIDSSLGMVKKAKKSSKGEILFGEAEKLPFKDGSFDKVICVSAIHNFDSPKTAIYEMKRVSKKVIVVTVMKKSRKFESIKAMLRGFKELDIGKDVLFVKKN